MKRGTCCRVLAVGLGIGLTVTACGGGRKVAGHPADRPSPASSTTSTTIPSTTTTSTTGRASPPAISMVAEVDHAEQGRSGPGGPVTVTVPADWYGYRSMLPVVARAPGWVEVRLAQRPNQSTAWLPESDVRLTTTPWHLVLSLGTRHLFVYRSGQLIYYIPSGIGATTDPTPTGHYFVAMTVPPPSAAYGAFVLATSAHSDQITDWENSGDAIIGIHGPIDSYDDSLIGTTGARISHGCIRLHDGQLTLLAPVLPGSPLDIVAD